MSADDSDRNCEILQKSWMSFFTRKNAFRFITHYKFKFHTCFLLQFHILCEINKSQFTYLFESRKNTTLFFTF